MSLSASFMGFAIANVNLKVFFSLLLLLDRPLQETEYFLQHCSCHKAVKKSSTKAVFYGKWCLTTFYMENIWLELLGLFTWGII